MAKKIFGVYLAKLDTPDSEAYTRLELPASPWELHDAMDKVQLQENEELYLEVDDYYDFEYLAPHLDGADISLNELNDLAGQLAALDEVQGIAFEGLFSMEVQKKISTNGGIITPQDLRDLAVSAKTDCYHIVDAADDAALGRFYAENDFIPELDGVSDSVFKMLDFAGIGRMMRQGENGVFVGGCYVLQDGEMTTAPPCSRDFPKKPDYLFRVTLGLHPDLDADQTVTLTLPASAEELKRRRSSSTQTAGKVLWFSPMMASFHRRQSLPTCQRNWRHSTISQRSWRICPPARSSSQSSKQYSESVSAAA